MGPPLGFPDFRYKSEMTDSLVVSHFFVLTGDQITEKALPSYFPLPAAMKFSPVADAIRCRRDACISIGLSIRSVALVPRKQTHEQVFSLFFYLVAWLARD